MGFGDCPHCGSNKEKPFSIPFPYEGRLLFTNTQAAYGGWPSERMHTKAWSSRQPTLHVPGGPRLEEVRLREERAEVVERAQKTSRGQGSHTLAPLQYFTGSKICSCVWLCVFVGVCKDETGGVGCESSDNFVLQQGDPL